MFGRERPIDRLVRLGIPIIRGGGKKPLVGLTFDDSPGPATDSILDALSAAGARASFFVVGEHIRSKEAGKAVRRIRNHGEVGNHTWSHPPLVGLAPQGLEWEIARTRVELARISRRPVRLFRPPYGERDTTVDRVVWSLGMLQVLWNVDARDTRQSDPDAIVAKVVGELGPGKIIHLHDREKTPSVLPPILAAIRERGLRPVTVSELLEEDPPLLEDVLSWGRNFWTKDPPQPLDGAVPPRRRLRMRGYLPAPALRYASPNQRPGRGGHVPRGIVIHTSVGSFRQAVEWFGDPISGVSSHYFVGMDGRVAQFVDERDTAFHAGRVNAPTTALVTDDDPNPYTIGIEFEDWGDPEAPRTGAQYEAGAALLQTIAYRWGIPLDRDHVVGHREIFAPKSCPGSVNVDRLIREAKRIPPDVPREDGSSSRTTRTIDRFRRAARKQFPDLVEVENGKLRRDQVTRASPESADQGIHLSRPAAPASLYPVWRWVVRRAKRYGIATIVFDRQIWTSSTPWVHTYTGPDVHADRIRVDFLASVPTNWVQSEGTRAEDGRSPDASDRR